MNTSTKCLRRFKYGQVYSKAISQKIQDPVKYLMMFEFVVAIGANQDPCSQIFAGFQPYSEPETKAVSTFVKGIEDRVTLFLTVHSYGQLWMAPWGYTKELPDNYDELVRFLSVKY